MDKLSESATTPRNSDPTTNFSNTSMPAETPQQRGVENNPTPNKWTVHVCPTTGGQFDIKVSAEDSIDNIKKCISKRLKISKERISLLHKERLLKEGTLTDNGVSEGGKITLLPNVESGLMSQRQENSVMQALENLSEPQVNDFLAGKSPLTLAMRLGDHMMFVQLQLSTSQSSSKRTTSSSSSSKHRSSKHSGSVTSSSSQLRHPATTAAAAAATTTPHLQQQQQQKQTIPSSSIVPQLSNTSLLSASSSSTLGTSSKVVVPVPVHAQPRSTSHPYAACLPRRSSATQSLKVPAAQTSMAPQMVSPGQIGASRQNGASGQSGAPKPATGEVAPKPEKLDGVPVLDSSALAEASRNLSKKLKELSAASSTHIKAPVDVKQKKKVKKTNVTEPVKGAIIESMQHHGQGVYSGTFSGTLNPALQDRNGKPKKSVSTIIHILNDLLGASPQYRAQMVHQQRHRARHAERMARTSHRTASKSLDQLRRQENRATRGKMEQLQMMMKERQERRKARREARASPYLPSWSSPNASQIAQMSTTHNTSTHSAMEVDANLEAAANNVSENMTENNGYTQQLQTETVVA